ncbi:MAG: cytochrome c biogenesis protein ResB [Prevotellaceae bacterium]|nr:cytochrome c biogenesis protein ResB [Prevotellaceae bacterium]
MWNKPYHYAEGTAICIGLLITGGLLQMTVGPLEWIIFKWPGNIIALAFLFVTLAAFYLLRRKAYFFRFITTVQAAVPALATAAILTVIMGLTRQVPEGKDPADPIGLTKMLSFWPFVLIYLWNAIIVAEVAIFQACHFQRKFIPSLVSHTGLFIFIVCGTLGSADMQKLKMFCPKGAMVWQALDASNRVISLPFSLRLNEFIDSGSQFTSDVDIYSTHDAKPAHAMIAVNKPLQTGAWTIYSFDYDKTGGKTMSIFELVSDPWLPATYVGLFLLIIGAILMFIQSRHIKGSATEKTH